MQNFSKTFFYRASAERFVITLKAMGAEDIQIWNGTDAFGQAQYTVRWN